MGVDAAAEQGALEPARGATLAIVYPLVPWIGVKAVGYAMGPLFLRPSPERVAAGGPRSHDPLVPQHHEIPALAFSCS